MITLTVDERDFIFQKLKPFLAKDDMKKVRDVLTSNWEPRIFAFLVENGIDVFADVTEIPRINNWERSLYEELTRFAVPSHIKSLAPGAFKDCRNLESISLDEGLESVGNEAFANTALKNIKFPRSIKGLGKELFKDCTNLKKVILPETVTKLPYQLFKGAPDNVVVYTVSRKDMPIEKQLTCAEDEVDWYVNHLKINTDYLYEKLYLREAWSPSTPNWLKPRLNRLAPVYNNNVFYSHRSPDDDYSYGKSRGEYHQLRDFYSILKNKNIDFEKIEFIEGDVPRSKKDERINPPNIGVWHFPNGQVYMSGINDLEKYDDYGSDYYDKAFRYIPFKMLRDEADAFCYFNVEETPTRDYEADKATRQEWRGWLADSDNTYARESDKKQKGINTYWDNFDKSGFPIVPSSRKYAEELRKRHAKEWASQLEECERELRRDFLVIQHDILGDVVWDDLDGLYNVQMDTIISYYKNAVRAYKEILRKVDEIKNSYGDDEEAFLSEMARDGYDSYNQLVSVCKHRLGDLDDRIARYKKVYLDF